MIFLN
jgi:hypothetical protein